MDEYISKTKFEELMHKKARNNFDLYYADGSKHYHANAVGYSIAADEAHVFPAADVQPKSQWISVDDSLPEEHKCVLVCEDGRVCTAWIHKGEWDALGTVTHWQPLPEPPKEE